MDVWNECQSILTALMALAASFVGSRHM